MRVHLGEKWVPDLPSKNGGALGLSLLCLSLAQSSTISASLGVPAALTFYCSKMLNLFSLSVMFFSLLALLVDVADSFRKWLKELKVCNDPLRRFGASLALSCIHIYMQHVYLKMDWGCRLCTHQYPSRNKLCCEYVRFTFGFLCSLSLALLKIYFLSLDLCHEFVKFLLHHPTFLA